MHKLNLPIRRGFFNTIAHQILDAENKEIAVISCEHPDIAKEMIANCNDRDFSKVEPHNKIVAPFICGAEYDGHQFDCYGTQSSKEAPEVEQIAIRGGVRDITHLLDKSACESIYADVERQWLNAKESHSSNYQ